MRANICDLRVEGPRFRAAMGSAGLGRHEFSSLPEPSLGTGCLSRLRDLFARRSESRDEIQARSPPRPASRTGEALAAARQGRADRIQASSRRRERQSVQLTPLRAADAPRKGRSPGLSRAR